MFWSFAGCQWFSTFSTMLAITQVGAAGDIPDSPEVVPAAADGAKSIMNAKVTRVHEEKSLVHLLPDVGDSRVVNLKSFTELWPMPPLCLGFCWVDVRFSWFSHIFPYFPISSSGILLGNLLGNMFAAGLITIQDHPRCGDRISFPPPAGGPTSRWILPTLEAMASSDGSNGSLDLASNFLKSIQLGYEEQGSSVLMRRSIEKNTIPGISTLCELVKGGPLIDDLPKKQQLIFYIL